MDLTEVIESLEELKEDTSIPRNIKQKISNMIIELKGGSDFSLKINKSLSELDDIANDVNTPMLIRTQIWGVASMLEKLQ